MAIEQTVIVDKLKEEGINETLGNGLSFETDVDLNAWVDTYKSGLPTQNKALNDYTKEELDEIAKDPQFKGAKGLQGLLDAVRQKAKPDPKPNPDPKPDDATALALKAIQDELKEMKGQKAVESFDKLVSKTCKAENLDSDDVDWVKSKLKSDASEEDVKTAIKDYKSFLAKKGIKGFGTPGGGGEDIYRPGESLSAKYAERYKKKHSKK